MDTHLLTHSHTHVPLITCLLGPGEVRLLALVARSLEAREASQGAHSDASDGERTPMPLLRLLDYFYYKEHLFIVTELLRDSLFNFYRYLNATQPAPPAAAAAFSPPAAAAVPGCRAYFSGSTLAALSRQLLRALVFLHELKITHCDLKPENVCIVSASRREFKVSKRMR